MDAQSEWRGLAVTYGVIACIQLYLAISMGAAWALALAIVFGLGSIAFSVAAWRTTRRDFPSRRGSSEVNLSRHDVPGLALG